MAESPRPHHWITLGLLTTAGISFALMQTLVIPALPFFRHEFDASTSAVAWLLTGFLLSSAVLTPILGKLGDAHGKKRVLALSLLIFGLGSLGCACANGLVPLVAFRVLQGAGAAVFPLSFGIIRDEFPPEKVGMAIGTVSSVFGVGGGLGLVLSGVILEHLDWRWLFLVGAGPVLVSCALIARFVPESPVKTPTRPDYRGAATMSLGLAALLMAVTEGPHWGLLSAGVLALAAAAVAMLAAFAHIERRVAEPLVDLGTLTQRAMAATNATTVLVGFSMTAFFVILPAFVQVPDGLPAPLDYGFGASPVQTGLFFVPCSLAMIVAGPLAGALGTRHGFGLVLRLGLGLMAAGFTLLAAFHGQEWTPYAWLAVMGTGVAFALAATGALVIAHAPAKQTGVAGGVNLIMRTVGGALGAQIAASVISASTPAGSPYPLERGFTIAFAIAAAGAIVGIAPTLLLGAGGESRRRLGRRRAGVRGRPVADAA
jgi:EmrB/QacA subfamily drug resistance transporter